VNPPRTHIDDVIEIRNAKQFDRQSRRRRTAAASAAAMALLSVIAASYSTISTLARTTATRQPNPVFQSMRPTSVLITTPNADFNSLLGVPAHRFRHPDHFFEWGRQKFRSWAEGVALRNGLAVACSDLAGEHPTHGGASQMAYFKQKGPPAP